MACQGLNAETFGRRRFRGSSRNSGKKGIQTVGHWSGEVLPNLSGNWAWSTSRDKRLNATCTSRPAGRSPVFTLNTWPRGRSTAWSESRDSLVAFRSLQPDRIVWTGCDAKTAAVAFIRAVCHLIIFNDARSENAAIHAKSAVGTHFLVPDGDILRSCDQFPAIEFEKQLKIVAATAATTANRKGVLIRIVQRQMNETPFICLVELSF